MPSSGLIAEETARPDTGLEALPEKYGATMAALLPKDPGWMFLYWEITADSTARIIRDHGSGVFETSRQVLRVHDMTSEKADGRRYFDVPVRLEAGNWYVNAPGGGGAYSCELGLVTPSGEFIGIVTSNTVSLPAGRTSAAAGGRWMTVTPDFDKLLELSGVEYAGKGSGEIAGSLARRWETLRSVFSSAASWGATSLSSGLRYAGPEKKFRLAADCEIILYGATEPGARVTVGGRKVGLTPDGTFSMRFALPDGGTELPVSAVPDDGTEQRQVSISLTRLTGRR
jgi:hypothetical protein